EFRVTVTIAEHGRDPENGHRFLRGFRATHPDIGPVVDQDIESGHLSVTFSYEAKDLMDAMNKWPSIFADGAQASGLTRTPLMDFAIAAEVQLVEGGEY